MCNSNNLLYSPQRHEYRVYRANGTIVQKGDKLVSRGETWDFDSCLHPRKIFVEAFKDPYGPHMWPNRTSQEFYPSVFNLGIYDMTDDEWTFPPSWDKSDIDAKLYEEFESRNTNNLTDADVWASYDKNIKTDEPVKTDETDMWVLIDQMYQRVTKCDGTVILTPRTKTDSSDEKGEFTLKPLFDKMADKLFNSDSSDEEVWERQDRRRVESSTDRMTSDSSGYSDEEVKAGKEHELHMLGESDIVDDTDSLDDADKPWVSPGPSESEKAEQADRVRRADAWVETGVWEKSDIAASYDEARKNQEESDMIGEPDNKDESDESDIADDDDKAELIRESDEQAELNETDKREFCIVFHPNHVNKDDCTEPFNKDNKE